MIVIIHIFVYLYGEVFQNEGWEDLCLLRFISIKIFLCYDLLCTMNNAGT